MALRGLPPVAPPSLVSTLAALVRSALPQCSTEQMAEILQLRRTVADSFGGLDIPLEELGEVMSKDDMKIAE
eukprot:11203021-Lingulodinium_polyedra.AAC.1